jgi:uroporphyrinogen-III synthase
VDSVLLTSANGARFAGAALAPFAHLPCYAVGEATAEAARASGFVRIVAGDRDGKAILDKMSEAGVERPLHLCGREHRRIERPGMRITRRCVYAAQAVTILPQAAAEVLRDGALPLLHSARAASHFASLIDREGLDRTRFAIAAISEAAAAAAGAGWRSVHSAPRPSDEALLELAAKLCKIEAVETGKSE